MIHGIKWNFEGTLFCKRDHFCNKCGSKLEVVRIKKVVNSESDDAKDYDFSLTDTFLLGNVKFVSKAFKCIKCDYTVSIKEQKAIEKANKI
ncbi:MAG: hypothetical protein ACYC5K_01880 [Saccharofermentanales bacterium]